MTHSGPRPLAHHSPRILTGENYFRISVGSFDLNARKFDNLGRFLGFVGNEFAVFNGRYLLRG
jgi:hypothetical protein